MIESFKMEDEIVVAQVLKDSRNWRVIDIVSFLRSMIQNLLILILTVAIEHYGCVQVHWLSVSKWVNCMVCELELNKTVKISPSA